MTGLGGWLIGSVVCAHTALGSGGGLACLVVAVVVAGLRNGLGGYGYGGVGLVGVEGEVEGEGVGGLDRGGFLDRVDPGLVLFSPFSLLRPDCWLGLLDVVWDCRVMQKRWSVFGVFDKDHRGWRLGLWLSVGSRCFLRCDCSIFTVYNGARL